MCAVKLPRETVPGNTPAGTHTADRPDSPVPDSSAAAFDGERGALRHAIGSEMELRLWAGVDERGASFCELRLYRRPVSELSRDASAFKRTDAGLRVPASHAAIIGSQLQGLGLWSDQLVKQEGK